MGSRFTVKVDVKADKWFSARKASTKGKVVQPTASKTSQSQSCEDGKSSVCGNAYKYSGIIKVRKKNPLPNSIKVMARGSWFATTFLFRMVNVPAKKAASKPRIMPVV